MSEDNYFWPKMARMISMYLASLDDKSLNKIWIDDILNPELVVVNDHQRRVLASSYTSEDEGKSFTNYKISFETSANSIEAFEAAFPFESWSEFDGKLNIVPAKKRITINAT